VFPCCSRKDTILSKRSLPGNAGISVHAVLRNAKDGKIRAARRKAALFWPHDFNDFNMLKKASARCAVYDWGKFVLSESAN
ncbi:hypothetical protein, partial [Klebsiella pneumoniae]|uniref:hypothetical protein n=1 Tax=Klebsiella pneumoniae TaxID=573 RepID=UPI00195409C7